MKEIPLTKGKVALVDDEDYERVNQYKWYAQTDKKSRTSYALRRERNKEQTIQRMHRFIMNAPDGIEVNHWDHNGLNNQKENLILSTHRQNMCYSRKRLHQKEKPTSSKYKGVYWNKEKRRWTSRIKFNGKVKHLGHFKEEMEAAEAYNNAAILYHGEFAILNEI